MKVTIGARKRPLRKASSGFVTVSIGPAGTNFSDNPYGSLTWIATLRWVKRSMWLLVLAVAFWDLAVTFGPHFGLAW
jgi:hypothetical protein